MTMREAITNYLSEKRNIWVHSGDLERYASSAYKPSALSRTARSMAESGELETAYGTATVDGGRQVINAGGTRCVWYKLPNQEI